MSEFRTEAGGRHANVPPELRQMAQAILDRLDPAVRLLAARATSGSAGGCQQIWCPVCALAALVNGEQHPLLTVIAEHSVALLAVVRSMAEAMDTSAKPSTPAAEPVAGGPDSDAPNADSPPAGPGRYQHIPVTVEE